MDYKAVSSILIFFLMIHLPQKWIYAVNCESLVKVNKATNASYIFTNKTDESFVCAPAGEFYKTELFKDKDKTQAFLNLVRKLTTAADCLADAVSIGLGLVNLDVFKYICKCDCLYAHGATGAATACPNGILPIGSAGTDNTICTCEYTKEDYERIICSGKDYSDWQSGIGEVSETECSPGGPAEQKLCQDSLCRPFFHGFILFACAPIKTKEGLDHYELEGHKIFPSDICAIDCFNNHGANKSPFGECVFDLVTGYEFCFCHF